MTLKNESQLLMFIAALRETDEYIKDIYLNGGCYQFHLLLKKFAPECQAYISQNIDHVVSEYKGNYYDIRGEVIGDFRPMTLGEVKVARQWSFSKHNALKVNECPYCEEPIIV